MMENVPAILYSAANVYMALFNLGNILLLHAGTCHRAGNFGSMVKFNC